MLNYANTRCTVESHRHRSTDKLTSRSLFFLPKLREFPRVRRKRINEARKPRGFVGISPSDRFSSSIPVSAREENLLARSITRTDEEVEEKKIPKERRCRARKKETGGSSHDAPPFAEIAASQPKRNVRRIRICDIRAN